MVTVTHAKVSAKSDSPDATLICPTDWNATHVGVLESKIVSFTRSMTAGNGSQGVTGVGFTPTAIVILGAGIGDTIVAGWTIVDPTTSKGMSSFTTSNFYIASNINLWENTGIGQVGTINSLDIDGFTISWVKSGAPASVTINLSALCLR